MVCLTNQLKLTASDGKKYNTDVVDSKGVTLLFNFFIFSFFNSRAQRRAYTYILYIIYFILYIIYINKT